MRRASLLTPIVLFAVSGSHEAVATEATDDVAVHDAAASETAADARAAAARLASSDADAWAVDTTELTPLGASYVYAPRSAQNEACPASIVGEDTALVPAACVEHDRCPITAIAIGAQDMVAGTEIATRSLHVCSDVVSRLQVDGVEYAVVKLDRQVAIAQR